MRFNLKEFRQSHKLYQSEIAEVLELNQSNVSRAELRGYINLTYPQLQTLYEKYGKEDVDSFMIDETQGNFSCGNINEHDGIQYNGIINTDVTTLNIIKQQSESLSLLAKKQSEQTDKLIEILEKLSERL